MREPVDQKLAWRLTELRAHCNISLAELASAVGVTKGTIWKYLRGRSHVPAERLETMARAMHCEERHFHMPPGSPLPRLRFRPAGRQTAPMSLLSKIDLYPPVTAEPTLAD